MATLERVTTTTVSSLCAYCGVGCGVDFTVDGDAKVTKSAGRKNHPTNFGRLCTKGSTTADMLNAGGRLTTAQVRPTRGDEPTAIDVDIAITHTARRLRAIIDEHGPDAVALYVSGQMSLEAQYLSNKLTKGFIGTNQIESNSRLCMASAGTGYKQTFGSDAPPGSYQDFDHADVFFVIGANMADCHPILFLRMMDRVKAGAKLIVVDPRRNTTAEKADLFLQVKGGTDLALLNGLLHLIIENGHTDPEFIADFTDGFEQMPEFAAQYPPDVVAQTCGIDADDLRRAAELIGTAENWMSCWTMGLNQSTHGTWNTNALLNLHMATGALCRTGSGPFSLTGQPNAMGGREMGYMGPGLPGQRAVLSDDDRAFCENIWGVPEGTLHTRLGGGTIDMYAKMAAGDIKACWIICTNPVASVANRKTVIEGLERAELVIVQETFVDMETSAYADVVLPASLWSESTGVFINSERNLTLFEPALRAPGQAIPDWQIIARVACEMGYADAFTYADAEEIFEEIKQFHNPRTGYDIRGVTYDRLRKTPMQWPCPPPSEERSDPTADGARNPIRYLNDGISQSLFTAPDGSIPRLAFATPNRRAQFFARPHMDPFEMPDDDYPILLNTGRLAHQWHTMTKTGRVAKLTKLNPGPFIEIHPDDAGRFGISEGDPVEVASRRGRAVLPASVSDRVRPGNCFAPFHWNDSFGEHLAINAVTSDAIDPASQQPEFKVCAVTLTKVKIPAVSAKPDAEPTAAETTAGAETTEKWRPELLTLLAQSLGVTGIAAPEPNDAERIYLAGLVAGLQANPAGVPTIPPDAPLRPEIRNWVAGLLSGMFARSHIVGAAAALPAGSAGITAAAPGEVIIDAETTAEAAVQTVTVIWASQTGNTEEFVGECVARLKDSGREVISSAMDDVDVTALTGTVLVLTATTGDGDPPDNGSSFWDALSADSAPSLAGVNYAVLGFGDSNYDDFCGHARNLDERIGALGGTRIADRASCEPDYGDTARAWLDTVLTALSSTPTADTAESPAEKVTVTWASQTGTAEEFAEQCIARLKESGREVVARAMDELDINDLTGTTLFLSSTTGDGDPPDNGSSFWDALSADSAPDLSGVNFSVLAFGDSSYDDFCGHGRKLDERIGALGGTRIADRADCEPDYEDTAGGWLDKIVTAMSHRQAPDSSTGTPDDRVVVVSEPADSSAAPSIRTGTFSRKKPFVTTLTRNHRLNADGSAKDVRNLAFHLPSDILPYTAGDALGVWPLNSHPLIDEWLAVTGLDENTRVNVWGDDMTFRRALRERLEFAKISADFVRFVAERNGSDDLHNLATPGNKQALGEWAWGRQPVDVLAEYPVTASAEEWVEVFKSLTPRQYSISSSPREKPDEVQLTVSTVRYNRFGVPRGGVCSTFLADHADDDQDIGVFVTHAANFGPPADPDAPMIMIGPGTGIAPFRGFLHERQALGHEGHNWLFFGEQYSATDFYYRDELTSMLSDGLLTRLDVAFSRDQDRKIYVQDRMREQGAELYRWLHDGAHVYVCGDASRMAKDVDRTLKGIVAQHGKLSPKSAEAYVKALAAEKRYVRDVY